MSATPTRFQRFVLPGLALKGVVIGGGYATGRELAEFFLPSGPQGGLLGLLLAMVVWSVVCAVTFMFARATSSLDYRSFFRALLGPFWGVFEAAYIVFMVLILAVFGAAAGAIGQALFGWSTLVGALCLMAGTALVTAFGSASVERLFKWASFFLYAVYALLMVFVLSSFGDRIVDAFGQHASSEGWVLGGLTYASYNIVAAVVILPVTRHFLSRRDAAVAGLLAGPLAMLPALLFFTCMLAWYPAIGSETLPSDFMLQRLDRPLFHLLFQLMIFAALLESAVGAVHAINERIDVARQARNGRSITRGTRLVIALVLLIGSIFIAQRFGLVDLIAHGYRALAGLFLVVYLVPLLTLGVWRLWRGRATAA